jgi:hypothetical protein
MLTYVKPPPHTITKHPLSQTIQRHHRSQFYHRLNYVHPIPTPIQNNQAHTTPRDRQLAILSALYAQCKYIVYSRTMYVYSIYKLPHIRTVSYI